MQSLNSLARNPGFVGVVATMVGSKLAKGQDPSKLDAKHQPRIIGVGSKALKRADEQTSVEDHARLAKVQDRREAKSAAVEQVVAKVKARGHRPAKRAPKHCELFQDSRGLWRERDGKMMSRERQAETGLFNPSIVKAAEARALAYMVAGLGESSAYHQADRDVRDALRRGINPGAKRRDSTAGQAKAPELKLGKNGLWYYGGRVVKGSKKGWSREQIEAHLGLKSKVA